MDVSREAPERCRCGRLLTEDGKDCQWHTAVQAEALRRLANHRDDEDHLTMDRVDRIACLRAAVATLQPLWENREPEVSDAILCARYIETGKDPYADVQPLPSGDAMRSHP